MRSRNLILVLVLALGATGCASTPAAQLSAPVIDCSTPSAAPRPECESTYLPGESPAPGQEPIDEATAVRLAKEAFAAPAEAPVQASLVPYATWIDVYGGAGVAMVSKDRPVWIVSVDHAPTFPHVGPPESSLQPAVGYTVVLDSYSAAFIEFVTRATPLQ